MQKRLLLWLVGVSFSLSAASAVAEKPVDWLGREVMLVAADVTFRDGPSPDASVVNNPTGGALRFKVDAVDGDWLQIKGKWVRRSDVTPLEAAVEFFSDQIERQSTPFALVSRAEVLKKQRQFDKALADANVALRLDPEFALGYKVRGYLHLYMMNSVEALQDLDKALALEPNLATARDGRDYVRGLLELKFAYRVDPRNAAAFASAVDRPQLDDRRLRALALFEIARQKGRKGDDRQAIADLEEAVRLAPELRTAAFFSDRSHHYSMLHEYDKAKADLREAISLEPGNALHHDALGNICLMEHDTDGAIEQFSRACALGETRGANSEHPTLADASHDMMILRFRWNHLLTAHILRGTRRMANGDVAGATADFDCAVEIDPKSSYARTSRAHFLARLGDFDRALQDFDVAIANDRESSSPLCLRGKVLLAKGDFAKAIESFNQAADRFPLEASPLVARAEAWTTKGQLGRALDDLNYATVLEPGNAVCYGKRAIVLRLLKRDDEAKADFEKAQELINALTRPQ